MIGIYCFRHKESGMCYVGQSRHIHNRVTEHKGRTAKRTYIDRAIKKYGIDAFIVEILELCDEDILHDRECHWIATLNSMKPNGYNLTAGGEGWRHTEETKRKISKSGKGRIVSEETRQRMSVWQIGTKHSPERIRNMVEGRKGYKATRETRIKMSIAHRRRQNPLQIYLFEDGEN